MNIEKSMVLNSPWGLEWTCGDQPEAKDYNPRYTASIIRVKNVMIARSGSLIYQNAKYCYKCVQTQSSFEDCWIGDEL